jgi:hypothetical protein
MEHPKISQKTEQGNVPVLLPTSFSRTASCITDNMPLGRLNVCDVLLLRFYDEDNIGILATNGKSQRNKAVRVISGSFDEELGLINY